ncbi:hypothetical protein IJI31_06895 [bacterium]|nr:hypothetical protein [bacterium]
MISGICPAEVYNIQNARNVISFRSIPFAAKINEPKSDVFVKSSGGFNEYGLKIQKCETKEDLRAFNRTIEKEFKMTILDKPIRQVLLLDAKLKKVKRGQYLIKNENNEITGAFHLYENKPDKKFYRQLYIAEMCVPEKFHKTKTSYDTLKTIFSFIKEKSKDFDCLTLDVDCTNKSLIHMYKKLGFYISGYDQGFYSMINALNPEVKDVFPEMDESIQKMINIKPHIHVGKKS